MRTRWTAVFVLLIACGDEPRADVDRAAGTLTACDPLAADPQPITLGTVIAAGKSVDGTLYVATSADKFGNVDRLFVSEGTTLVRKRIAGSGQGGAGDAQEFTISIDSATPLRLVFAIENGEVAEIGLVRDGGKSFLSQLNGDYDALTVVKADAVKGMPLRNFAGDVLIEEVAHSDDGLRVVVTRPTDDWTYDDFRVFFGRDGQLDEHPLVKGQSQPKSYRSFSILGEDGDYELTFSSALNSSVTSALVHGDQTWPLTLDDAMMGVPAGTTFRCID